MVKQIFATTKDISDYSMFDIIIYEPTKLSIPSSYRGIRIETDLLNGEGEENIISFIELLRRLSREYRDKKVILVSAPAPFLENWLMRPIRDTEQVGNVIDYEGLPEPFLIDATTKFFSTWGDAPHETETFNIFRRFLNKEKPYLDIGVCYGQTAIYGSLLSKHVIGVEPDPIAYRDASKNISINRYKNVTLYPYAIGDNSGVAKFGSKSGNWGNSKSTLLITEGAKHTIDVEIRTMRSLLEECPLLSEINFIKMDVEGAEKFIVPNFVEYFGGGAPLPTLYISLHTKWNLISKSEEEVILGLLFNLYNGNPLHRDMNRRLTTRQITRDSIEQLIYTKIPL